MVREDRRFDVAIVGAGPAGSAAALRLARAGRRVAILERSQFDAPRVGESFAPSIRPLLDDLGLWERFQALDPLPSNGVESLWATAERASRSFLASPYGTGWHVDRLAFDRMLADAAAEAGADLATGVRIAAIERTASGGWSLTVDGDAAGKASAIESAVVIDATGRGASLAQRLGAHRFLLDHLVAVAAYLDLGGDSATTLVETDADGWWYSAPIARDRMVAMRMTDGDLASDEGASIPAQWLGLLASTTATRDRLKGAAITWGPQVFSAVSQRLTRTDCDAPWLAVGDAALAVDPLSGSGVLRALSGAETAADVALEVLAGNPGAIAPYEADLDAECTRYLEVRAAYYAMERRWPDSEFWRRRAPRGR